MHTFDVIYLNGAIAECELFNPDNVLMRQNGPPFPTRYMVDTAFDKDAS